MAASQASRISGTSGTHGTSAVAAAQPTVRRSEHGGAFPRGAGQAGQERILADGGCPDDEVLPYSSDRIKCGWHIPTLFCSQCYRNSNSRLILLLCCCAVSCLPMSIMQVLRVSVLLSQSVWQEFKTVGLVLRTSSVQIVINILDIRQCVACMGFHIDHSEALRSAFQQDHPTGVGAGQVDYRYSTTPLI